MPDETPPPPNPPPSKDESGELIKRYEEQIRANNEEIQRLKTEAGKKVQEPAASEKTMQALLESNRTMAEAIASLKAQRRKWLPWSL
jgi:hypothetical protein